MNHFMLLLTIAVFLLCCFLNKLQALFCRHFKKFIKDEDDETQKTLKIKSINQT
jgi:hypothetical protein